MGVKLCMVGVGSFGSHFIPFYRDHPWVDSFALCDLDSNKLKKASKEYGLNECYSSLEEACNSDLDGLIISTQPWLHAPQAIQALESGKHVCSAVPVIMLSDGNKMLEWCDKLINTVKKTGKHYALNETSYFQPQTMFCRRKVAQRAMGKPVVANGYYRHDYNHPNSNMLEINKRRWANQWDNSKTGETPMYYCTHSMGAVIGAIGGRALKVTGVGFQYDNDQWFHKDTMYKNPYSNEMALIKLDNGVTVHLDEMRRIGAHGEGFDLYGTNASFRTTGEFTGVWETINGTENLTAKQMRDPLPKEVESAWLEAGHTPERIYKGHGGSHAYLVHEFVDVVKNNRTPKVNAWQAVRYMAPGIIAHQSIMRDGEWLEVPDWGDSPD